MEVAGKVVVVTGGGRGIGAAMCRRFSAEGAERVYVTDCDEAAARTIADEIPRATGLRCDVSVESDVKCVVSQVMAECGRIEIFCSNAGITVAGGLETENADWQKLWDVNVMSRLYAARAVVPSMLEAGAGYLVHVASAAGLLTEIGSAGYSVTKHADVAMAEWLSVCYGRQGIRVSCVCPLGVKTDMINDEDPIHRYLHLHLITPEDVAESVIAGMRDEHFLILPHPEVAEFFARKPHDYDQWLRGMQRLRQKLTGAHRQGNRRSA